MNVQVAAADHGASGRAENFDVVAHARALVDDLRARRPETATLARIPPETVDQLQEAGLFALAKPRVYGGLQTSVVTWMEAVTELGRGDGGVAWAVSLLNSCTWIFATLFPKPIVDEVFSQVNVRIGGVLSPRNCTARRVEGGYLVEKGVWSFNSGVYHADWEILGIPFPDKTGKIVGRGIGVVPISDVTLLHDWDTIGLRGSGSSSVSMTNVFIPDERIVAMSDAFSGNYRGAFPHEPLYRAAFMPVMAIILSFPVLGLGMHMLEQVVQQLPGRAIPYTGYARQIEAPITHLQLGEAAAKIEAAKLMVAQTCREIDDWAERGEMMPEIDRGRARLFTGMADRYVWEAVDLLASAGGGSLARRGNVLNQIWQDVRIASMHGIASPSTNIELYGRLLCGLDSNGTSV